MRIRNAAAACAVVLVPAIYLTVLNAANAPVADAAMQGDKTAVQALIKQKADVNIPQADGATAIQWAAYRDDLDLADALIAAGADVKKPNRDGATALRLAAINGSAPMIEKLLKAGADANEASPNGETALMFASRNGNPAAVKVLLDAKADPNAKEKLRGTTPLMWAAEQAHPEAIKLLLASGADYKAASSFDTKGGRAYLAPTVRQRAESDQAAGGLRAQGRQGGRGAGRGQQAKQGKQAKAGDGAAADEDQVAALDAAAAEFSFGRTRDTDGGGLTPLVFATRQNCLECVKELLAAGADVNQVTHYGWTPLLTATQNRHYKIGEYLLEHGANPNIKNNGGWSPLYLATDNRNIESGDYPVRKPDMDHLEFIKLLLAKNADVNVRVCGTQSTPTTCTGDSTETRTNFTMQWLNEDGATPFLRAAQSSDVELMKLLLAKGADPKIATARNVTALAVAAGIAWVEGVTFETSREQNVETVKMLLDLAIDPNIHDEDGRTSLHGAAH
ncbi:MAG TPA: ankyrin repeat domain-containing protein, partial [Bryobacteraceae bacterium]|nr:ankyrin repeat domain-containing protein [Bryobacteraceae bacterium]